MQAVGLCRFLRSEQKRACSVIDTRSIAGGHGAIRLYDRLQSRQAFVSRIRPRMLILLDPNPRAIFLWYFYGYDLLSEKSVRLRSSGSLLAAQREAVLVLRSEERRVGE